MFRGRFHIYKDKKLLETVENQICTAGAESFLKMMWRGTTTDVAVGANFYAGICGSHAAVADTLADVLLEPSGAGGYARQAFSRDATGVPTIGTVNSIWRAKTKNLTFSASGAAISQPLTRLFISNAASGTVGILFAYSGALVSPITIADGQSYQVAYEFYLQ